MLAGALLLGACSRVSSGPLPQRGYLWQREWTPAVAVGLAEGAARLDGVAILGAEVVWRGGKPETKWATIDWPRMATLTKPCALAVRIAPYAGPFLADDAAIRASAETVRTLLGRARAAGVKWSEVQIDFDCAQKKLAGYRTWLRVLRSAVGRERLVITALPAWLEEPELPALLREADGWILQVHSVPTRAESGHTVLCDPALARKWVQKAARLGRPFSVALPTYRCLAGFEPGTGRLLGNAMDSVQPAWPPGTLVLDLASDAEALAGLVREWKVARPTELREILWYRLPVSTDALNWRWATLAAVMAGRAPGHRLEVEGKGAELVDLSLHNRGEAEELLDRAVTVTWQGPPPVAGDALAGWTLDLQPARALFRPPAGHLPRLAPEAACNLGWLRYDQQTTLHFELASPHDR